MRMSDTTVKLTPMKKAMAKQMIRSLEIPQFQIETEVNCEKLMALRKEVPYRPSVTTVWVKAVTEVLKSHPILNSSYVDTSAIELHEEIGMGIAVDTPKGLVVPVIHHAEAMNLQQIHEAMEEIKEKGKTGRFSVEDLTGGTFTVSSLGMFRVTSFKAIVNTPQAGILALSRITEKPVVNDGKIRGAKIMKISLSADHRVADGAECARFISELAELIENPENII